MMIFTLQNDKVDLQKKAGNLYVGTQLISDCSSF